MRPCDYDALFYTILHVLSRLAVKSLGIFQILVHPPQSFPEVAAKGVALGLFEEVFLDVSAKYSRR